MSPLYLKNNKLLVQDNKLASDANCCCPEWASWLRSHMRIGGNTVFEQGWLVTLGQPIAAPYIQGQIPNQNRNAEWSPNSISNPDQAIMYPPQSATQTFYIIYNKAARTIRYKLSNADTTGRVPPWPTPESIAAVPLNKLTEENIDYPINVEVFAGGRVSNYLGVVNSTLSSGMKLFNCSIQVVGEPPAAIPDTEIIWLNPTNNTANLPPQKSSIQPLPGYKLGKGFTITGSATMSWEGIRPAQSQVQGWFKLFDFTDDYII